MIFRMILKLIGNASKALDFISAAQLRDEIKVLQEKTKG